jgi:integrase/recombinase XerD
MIGDATVRNLSPPARRFRPHATSKFSRFFGRSPDRPTPEEVLTLRKILDHTSSATPTPLCRETSRSGQVAG